MLVADLFAALILIVATATILVVEFFAIGQRRTPAGADPALAGPILLVLTGGVGLAFLTGDLFTLFVAFELILVASYVLLTHQGREAQIRSGMTYVVINLFASTLFLFGVAIVYAATGTVNMALLAERIPELPGGDPGRDRAVVPRRVRHQGGDLPAVLLAPRLLSDGPDHDHRGLRRTAHQDRRVRPHPLLHADRNSTSSARCCW